MPLFVFGIESCAKWLDWNLMISFVFTADRSSARLGYKKNKNKKCMMILTFQMA